MSPQPDFAYRAFLTDDERRRLQELDNEVASIRDGLRVVRAERHAIVNRANERARYARRRMDEEPPDA